MFFTIRGDPRAMFDAGWGCNDSDDSVQRELVFRGRGTSLGGHICVRLASGNRWEFRYSPPDNPGLLPPTSLFDFGRVE